MKTIKSIYGKSLLIGGLLVAVMFIGVAAQEAPKKASKKAEQKYEYAWIHERGYSMATGDTLKGDDPDSGDGPWLRSAPNINWAAKDGWEVCPSGINHSFNTSGRGNYYTLMRRPIK